MKKITSTSVLVLSLLLIMGQGCFSFGPSDGSTETSGPAGVFVSIDKGEEWKQISLLPKADGVKNLSEVSVYRIEEDPMDPKAMYWASRENGLFFSYDDGKTWQQASAPLNAGFIYSSAVHPTNKCIIFATDGAKVYKSIDCSRSWKEVHREDRQNAKLSDIEINQFNYKIYISKLNGDLLVSTDLGETWTILNRFEGEAQYINGDATKADTLYVATKEDGLFRSDDAGKTWVSLKKVISEYPKALKLRRFYVHPTKTGVLYWVSTYGILKTTDGGDTWEPMNLFTSPGSVDIYGFAVNPQNDKEIYYTTTEKGRSTLYRTDDGGVTWSTKRLPTGQVPTAIRVHPEHGDYVYVGFTIPPK
ncbi:hypothetical protein KJ641_00120 [Patescibacteria group bacterium]|nr:hypothetical protein [Patescibacteria group bacterium]MBU1895264.1 hypothetical protein [Patescibacteria group bacterium]